MPDASAPQNATGPRDLEDSPTLGLKNAFGLNSDGLHSEIQTLKDDIKTVRADLAALVAKAGDLAGAQAKRQVKRQTEKAEAVAEDAAAKAEVYRGLLEDTIRTHPLASVGIALVAGMLVSSIGRR